MTTLVGTQVDFGEALKDLVELDYDAVEAYETAINRVDDQSFKNKLTEFQEDHRRHIQELSTLLKKHGITPPEGPDITKKWLAKGKVVLSNMLGDKSILAAMSSNETDMVSAYERMNERDDKWSGSIEILKKSLEDERRHKAWLSNNS